MTQKSRPDAARAGRAVYLRASLSSLEPIDHTPFKSPSSPVFIWITIVLVWLISLLPWRVWPPAPDLLLLVIAFWTLNEPRRVSLFTAFAFGLIMDVHDGLYLGEQALTYVLIAYGAVILARRLHRFHPAVQALHMLPIFIGAEAVSHLLHSWLASEWAGWSWLWSALLTVLLWPLADVLLHMPQRRLDETDSGST
jgi:rod shape-determining protein MreD